MGSSERDVEIRRGFSKASTHFLLVLVLFLLPDIIWTMQGGAKHIPQYTVYVKSIIFILVFYLNLLLIAPKTLGVAGHQWRFIVYNVAVLLIALALCWEMWDIGQKAIQQHYEMQLSAGGEGAKRAARHIARQERQGGFFNQSEFLKSVPFLIRDGVMIILSIGLSVAMFFSNQWDTLERKSRKLEALQKEEELKNLRAQIHPHFLFNTLNTIYALIEVAPEQAQDAVHTLSRFLRHILYDSPEWSTVESELEFLQNYLTLMQLRMSSTKNIDITLEEGTNGSEHIPPLMLITVIENVFKHGDVSKPIEISIVANDQGISCHTKNYIEKAPSPRCYSHSDDLTHASTSGTGSNTTSEGENAPMQAQPQKRNIGMNNLRRRLDLTYGEKARLDVKEDADTYQVTLELPYLTGQQGSTSQKQNKD